MDPAGQGEMFEKSLEQEMMEIQKSQLECLGMTFPNDEKRREYFLSILREKLKDPEFRKIEGFPIGSDEDILALSDPPYYTACPNPFIADFIKHYGKPYDPSKPYSREPFATDVSEGKNDPIYNAHSYHTKVPHKAIMRYILHYTEPGDVVFDGFCGTGMTGVAAQMCRDKAVVESLGYRADKDGTISQRETDENGKDVWRPFSKLGARRAVLNDLSPAATFIAYNYNTPVDVHTFEREAKRILKEVQDECGWMYETLHTDGKTKGNVNYTVWSEVFRCTECGHEATYWNLAVDQETRYRLGKADTIACPACSAKSPLRGWERVFTAVFDQFLKSTIRQVKIEPVLISYSLAGTKHEKTPDEYDRSLLRRISIESTSVDFKTERMPEGDEARRNDDIGLTHSHHFYSERTLAALSLLWSKSQKSKQRLSLMFWLQSVGLGFTRLNRYLEASFSQVNRYLKGTLYVAPFVTEVSPRYPLHGKVGRMAKTLFADFSVPRCLVSTESATGTLTTPNSVDYIFTDPPFGGNIMYSDLNFLWENWLRVYENNGPEAVVSSTQLKSLADYQELMTRCFTSYYDQLKPGRWMTVEFHNSKNSVWNSIQEALQRAGFVVADVRTLDKQQMTMQQMTSGGAVKQDLVISAYKPNGGFEDRFKLEAGTEEGVWNFIRTHLKQLPVFVSKDGQAEVIAERQNYLLFDRMVAFHVQRGVTVPLSAAEFYAGIVQRFSERDGMFFLPEQATEYDKKRMTVREVLQLQLFVTDESSAIQWLKQQLIKKPQTFQELHPQFLKEIGGWQKHEKPLELSELLEQSFLRYDGKGEVPNQIHSYLSTNIKELRNLPKDDESLRAKGKDRWYVPDPNKAGDLEKLRERSLLKEFEDYRTSSQKRLKVFRLEAVRAGFKKAWQERDYAMIISVARKIPENVLQEDPKLLMWYDQALTRTGGES
jgi:DNA modification methylase